MPSRQGSSSPKDATLGTLQTGTTPRLRFLEFRRAGDWAVASMGTLYAFLRNNTLSRDQLNYERGAVKNIHYGDIHTKFSTLFDIRREVVPFVNEFENVPPPGSDDYCQEGDLIFADASEDTNDVGKSIEVVRLDGQRLLAGQHTILARRKDNRLTVGFGGHLFRSEYVRAQIRKEAQGTKVYAISATRLGNVRIAYPTETAEQQKIADCLTSLDEAIAAQGRKVEALKAHKKGLMQHLFPQEGQTLPRLRFPEFRDGPEWQKRRISDLLEKNAKPATLDDDTLYREIGVRSHGKGLFHKEPTTGKAIGEKRVFHVIPNALVINIVFAWEQALAVTTEAEAGFIASHRFPMFVPKENQCDVAFIQRLFLMPAGKQLLKVASPGGAGRNRTLSQTEFEHLEVVVPDTPEQTRIVDCLASIDAAIAAAFAALTTLKTHKVGLMQGLFPAAEPAR